jgi:DNA-binding transcriptional regulator YdaS (Cro superfamily)
MKKQDAIDYFGSAANLARELGISKASISQWGDDIPKLRAFELEQLTKGKLKTNFAARF